MARRSYRRGRTARPSSSEGGFDAYLRNLRRRRRDKDNDKDNGGIPVEPNKPNTLRGGAAAELEFDD
jgi:hypothetical protein